MAEKTGRKIRAFISILAGGLCFWSGMALATNVGLAGVIGSRAILVIDGGSPRTLSVGQEYQGVKLLSVQGDSVKVDIGGKPRTLKVGQNAVAEAPSGGGAAVVLTADGQGHFQTSGSVNGVSMRFLLDTGATAVSLGAGDAKRLGLDLSKAERGVSQTANGQTVVYRVKLDKVQVGDITLYGVEGSVNASHDMPFALLGMSFLNRTDMQREGDKMTLRKRF